MSQQISPKINRIEWGRVEVSGYDTPFRDVKLFPGGAREWDWRETGTHHVPGIQPADVEELLSHEPEVVVLSKGFWEKLQTKDETRQLLANKGVRVVILETGEAVKRYNELAKKQPVAGLFHSTC